MPVDGQLTVVQAILQLGGLHSRLRSQGRLVIRKGGPKRGVRINAKAVLNGENDKDLALQPGDTVKVDRKAIGIQF